MLTVFLGMCATVNEQIPEPLVLVKLSVDGNK